jgi:hypothetical protein
LPQRRSLPGASFRISLRRIELSDLSGRMDLLSGPRLISLVARARVDSSSTIILATIFVMIVEGGTLV